MKEHIKLFPTVASADGHIIDAPFISAIHQEQGDPILVRCKEDGKKLQVTSGVVSVVNAVELISFTIRDITGYLQTYYAEEGMTWEEWINSKYNTGGFYISSFVDGCPTITDGNDKYIVYRNH